MNTAGIALVVKDPYHKHGIGTGFSSYLTYLARRKGILGFTAEVLNRNRPAFKLFNKMGFYIKKENESGAYETTLLFKDIDKMLQRRSSDKKGYR